MRTNRQQLVYDNERRLANRQATFVEKRRLARTYPNVNQGTVWGNSETQLAKFKKPPAYWSPRMILNRWQGPVTETRIGWAIILSPFAFVLFLILAFASFTMPEKNWTLLLTGFVVTLAVFTHEQLHLYANHRAPKTPAAWIGERRPRRLTRRQRRAWNREATRIERKRHAAETTLAWAESTRLGVEILTQRDPTPENNLDLATAERKMREAAKTLEYVVHQRDDFVSEWEKKTRQQASPALANIPVSVLQTNFERHLDQNLTGTTPIEAELDSGRLQQIHWTHGS